MANTFEIMKIIIEEKFEFLCVGKKNRTFISGGKFQRERKLVKIFKYLVARTPSEKKLNRNIKSILIIKIHLLHHTCPTSNKTLYRVKAFI